MAWYNKFYDHTGLIEVGGVNLPACSWFGPPPDELMEKIKMDMAEADLAGDFTGMFKGECKSPKLPTRQKFKESIKPGMKLTKRTFLNILAYDISTPGYADDMLARMELLGCTNARNYYAAIKVEWEYNHEKIMKKCAEWLRKQDFERKEVSDLSNQKRKQEVELLKADLRQKSDRELLTLLQSMK